MQYNINFIHLISRMGLSCDTTFFGQLIFVGSRGQAYPCGLLRQPVPSHQKWAAVGFQLLLLQGKQTSFQREGIKCVLSYHPLSLLAFTIYVIHSGLLNDHPPLIS